MSSDRKGALLAVDKGCTAGRKGALLAVDKKLVAGEYYESFHLLQTILSRYAKRNDLTSIVDVGTEYAGKLTSAEKDDDHEQHSLACHLLMDVMNYAGHAGMPKLPISAVEAILSVASKCNPSQATYNLFGSILKATTRAQTTVEVDDAGALGDIVQRIHFTAGCIYMDGKEFGTAQSHFLTVSSYPGIQEKLVELFDAWTKQVYPSERDLLLLRCVLILHGQGKLETADSFTQYALSLYTGDETPAALHCAYFVNEACKHRNLEFFRLARTKYQLVVRRDPSFAKILDAIEEETFGVQRGTDSSASGLLGNIFQLLG